MLCQKSEAAESGAYFVVSLTISKLDLEAILQMLNLAYDLMFVYGDALGWCKSNGRFSKPFFRATFFHQYFFFTIDLVYHREAVFMLYLTVLETGSRPHLS